MAGIRPPLRRLRPQHLITLPFHGHIRRSTLGLIVAFVVLAVLNGSIRPSPPSQVLVPYGPAPTTTTPPRPVAPKTTVARVTTTAPTTTAPPTSTSSTVAGPTTTAGAGTTAPGAPGAATTASVPPSSSPPTS